MKGNFKMEFLMVSEHNMLKFKSKKEKIKLIKLLSECIKVHGLNMKVDLKMTSDKVLVKHILKMEDGSETLNKVSHKEMDYGKDQIVKY